MKELLPGIWTWSVFNPEKGLNFNGWYVKKGLESVVIDPPTPGESVIEEVRRLGRPKAILLTNKHHTRASEVFRRHFETPVWIHDEDRKLMEIPVNSTFKDGGSLPCKLQAVRIPDSKTSGECAFYLAGENPVMFVGDAVIGKPSGSLSMLPDEKFKDPKKAREGLRALLNFDFDSLLLGDGESILTGGREALSKFLG